MQYVLPLINGLNLKRYALIYRQVIQSFNFLLVQSSKGHMDVQIENQDPSLRLNMSTVISKRRSLTIQQRKGVGSQASVLSPNSISFSSQFRKKKTNSSQKQLGDLNKWKNELRNKALDGFSSSMNQTDSEGREQLQSMKEKAKEMAMQQIERTLNSTQEPEKVRNIYNQLWQVYFESLILQKTQQAACSSLRDRIQELKFRKEPLSLKRMVKIDAKLLNYGKYFSGRVLGSTIVLMNKHSRSVNLRISLDISDTFSFNKIRDHCSDIPKSLFSGFPFNLLDLEEEFEQGNVQNSEAKFKCWSLESLETKRCVKSLELKLDPKETREIVIVHQSPPSRQDEKLIAFLNIENRDPELNFSLQPLHVMLMGKNQIPRLLCQKVLKDAPSGISLIKLALKPNQHLQRFKIPFKNMCDAEYDLEFQHWSPHREISDRGFEYSFLQSQIKMLPRCINVLTLIVKNSNISPAGLLLEGKSQAETAEMKLRMLVGRVKDSNISFKFMIECYFIPRS